MTQKRADIVLINPGNRREVYQSLGDDVAAIEPPFLVAVMAARLRQKGYTAAIVDANAESLAPDDVARRVKEHAPYLAAVIVYGSQPSASTQNMTSAGLICTALKEQTHAYVAIGGLHPSALPEQTLNDEQVDFVIQGEGFETVELLLGQLLCDKPDLLNIPGLWLRRDTAIHHLPPPPLISDLDACLPAAAWDLLPMHLYRAHNWHCFDDPEQRSPYGVVYTSLGCPYNCRFCCINAPFGKPGIRYRTPARVVEEIDLLVNSYGVRNLKIADELFILHESHYMTIVDLLCERDYRLNIWAYARLDTIKPGNLARMKRAGINWLALGIESANQGVLGGSEKRTGGIDVRQVVRSIRDAGIRVIGNYIFGLPDDTMATMHETLEMALALNCEFANFYCAMPYPGSQLYDIARQSGWQLPDSWRGFSQHGFETLPLPTGYVTAAEVLAFRDAAFHTYFANPSYLGMIEETFGLAVREHIEQCTSVRLKRKLLHMSQ